MRTPLRVGVALTVILALFVPVATSFAAASISVSPTIGVPGGSTTVSGGGFAANTAVRILFDGSGGPQVGSESSDASGNLPSLAFVVPNVLGGTHQIFATDGTNTATTEFSVTNLALSPNSGGPGTSVTISGTGFSSGEAVSIAWDVASNQLTTATANGSGGFSASFVAPNGTGSHQVIATGTSSQ
ncbi:MAG: hypothetical protein LC797_19015, partial [Chloroflexi bacterium]|nr:hypothetical protein [Chloroflexota bacterium]